MVMQEPLLDEETAVVDRVQHLRQENRVLKLAVASLAVAGGCMTLLGRQVGEPQVVERIPAYPTVSLAEDDDVKVPEAFDTRHEWLGCGTFVVDQGQCGSCWAASTSNVFGDRICIHLQSDGSAIPLPHEGAHGAGMLDRMFQQAGICVGNGTMGMAHEHGCLRGVMWVSPQPLISCGNHLNLKPPRFNPYSADSGYQAGHTMYPSSSGCKGGESQDAWRYLYHEGLSMMTGSQAAGCTPYTSHLCSFDDPYFNGCRNCDFELCADTGLPPKVFTASAFGWIMEEDLPERGMWYPESESFGKEGTDKYRPLSQKPAMDRQVRKMQIEMMTNGPLHTCIDVYSNFQTFFNLYPQAIYNITEDSPFLAGHCIELMGWGLDHAANMPYWTWKNSWGTNFANGGFARFIRGVDLCGIESDVWTGCPAGSNCELTAGVVHNETWVPNHAWFPVAPGAETTTKKPERRLSSSTSAKKVSRSWPGGKEVEITQKGWSHPDVAPLVIKAVRRALGDDLTDEEALSHVSRVWTSSARGIRARVQVRGVEKHAVAIHHMEGHLTAL